MVFMNVLALPISFNIFDLKVRNLSFVSFIAAIFVYALWGSPTPDNLGWAEVLIAALLVGAFLKPAMRIVTQFRIEHVFLVYGSTLR